MKTWLFVLLCLCAAACTAQTQPAPVVETADKSENVYHYPMPAGKKAVLDLSFARQITVLAWDKPELQCKVSLRTSMAEYKDRHNFTAEDGKEQLRIKADFDHVKGGKNKSPNCWRSNCDSLANQEYGGKDCPCLQIDYEIYLPAGASLSLETISGDIEIRGLDGDLQVKTISGFIDIARDGKAGADLAFKSVTGEMYSDFDIMLDKNSSHYSPRLHAALNGGGANVSAETVSGDIFFRKR